MSIYPASIAFNCANQNHGQLMVGENLVDQHYDHDDYDDNDDYDDDDNYDDDCNNGDDKCEKDGERSP